MRVMEPRTHMQHSAWRQRDIQAPATHTVSLRSSAYDGFHGSHVEEQQAMQPPILQYQTITRRHPLSVLVLLAVAGALAIISPGARADDEDYHFTRVATLGDPDPGGSPGITIG